MEKSNIKKTIGDYLLKLGHELKGEDENGLTKAEAEQVHTKFMAESLLEDGTTMIVSPSDEWAAGVEVYVSADGEQMPLPVGEYVLQDGSMIVVENDGVVANYTPANVEEEATNVEQEKGATQEAPTQSPQAKAIIESVVKETKFSETPEYKSLIETVEGLKAELSKLTEENSSKFSAVAGSIETLTNEVVEMSKPMDKVKHSPEKTTKSEVVELSKQEISNMSVANRIKYFQNKLKK
jgi:hypothetical protein